MLTHYYVPYDYYQFTVTIFHDTGKIRNKTPTMMKKKRLDLLNYMKYSLFQCSPVNVQILFVIVKSIQDFNPLRTKFYVARMLTFEIVRYFETFSLKFRYIENCLQNRFRCVRATSILLCLK